LVYRNNAGRLGAGFISVCLKTHWLGQKRGFYVPEPPCSRDEIWSLFAQGQPLICLQDLRIPRKLISTIQDELHAQFPHYWIIISTVNKQGASGNSSGEHYNFTTLTALESHHFPSATSETLNPGRQLRLGKGLHPIVSGWAWALSTTIKSGGKFVIIDLYQFTAANPAEQKKV